MAVPMAAPDVRWAAVAGVTPGITRPLSVSRSLNPPAAAAANGGNDMKAGARRCGRQRAGTVGSVVTSNLSHVEAVRLRHDLGAHRGTVNHALSEPCQAATRIRVASAEGLPELGDGLGGEVPDAEALLLAATPGDGRRECRGRGLGGGSRSAKRYGRLLSLIQGPTMAKDVVLVGVVAPEIVGVAWEHEGYVVSGAGGRWRLGGNVQFLGRGVNTGLAE